MTTTAAARLDLERLEELRELGADDPGFLPQIVAAFLEDLARLLARLRQLTVEGQREASRRVSHTIRGSSRTVGASRLGALTLRFDALLAAGPPDGALAIVDDMEREREALADDLPRAAASAAAGPR